ncbi:hypothetical protein [Alexandriicola marinus]|uniref:hypothetical protein n=1 Tax=Alexandriicola marinus TaxID=2081710 RepID=UPI0030B83FB0
MELIASFSSTLSLPRLRDPPGGVFAFAWGPARRPKEGGTSDDRGAVQASFAVASATNVLTLFLYAAPNASSVWVRVVEEVSGAVAEVEITANLPAATQLLSPRNYMNTGSTAAAVAHDCSGFRAQDGYFAADNTSLWGCKIG